MQLDKVCYQKYQLGQFLDEALGKFSGEIFSEFLGETPAGTIRVSEKKAGNSCGSLTKNY